MKRLLCLLLAFFLLALPARGDAFKDANGACSVDIPDGWTPLAPADVESADAGPFSPDAALKCFAGFARGDTVQVLLSISPYPRGETFDALTPAQIRQLAATLTGSPRAEFHSAPTPAIGNMGAGTTRQVTCITDPPGFVVDYRYRRGRQEMRSHSVAFLGRDHVVILHFFMASSDYPFVKRSMDEIAGSFQYNSRQALRVKTSAATPLDVANWGIYLFVALLLTAAGFIVRYLFKRQAY